MYRKETIIGLIIFNLIAYVIKQIRENKCGGYMNHQCHAQTSIGAIYRLPTYHVNCNIIHYTNILMLLDSAQKMCNHKKKRNWLLKTRSTI